MQFLAGNAVALLENGEQYFPALEAAIDAAAHEIFLQSYIFDDDRTGRRIAAALAKEMEKLGRRPDCYIQVNTGEEPQKAGILPKDLDAVVVTASPLKGNAESVATPVDVLYGEDLDKAKAGTLGETVAKLPGVQTTYFGTGVGRPIIRGQEGPRVQVLSGGIGSMDASTVSADHAVSIEPFLAEQIEVLKGPATLLYGPGAIGGAVNVVDGRVPHAMLLEFFTARGAGTLIRADGQG